MIRVERRNLAIIDPKDFENISGYYILFTFDSTGETTFRASFDYEGDARAVFNLMVSKYSAENWMLINSADETILAMSDNWKDMDNDV